MTSSVHEFDRYADVRSALADPHLVPLPAAAGPIGSMAWLRATVSRFSSGETHARRRALVEADLAHLDPAALRRAAATGPDGDARRLVVRTLAQSLGLAEPDAIAASIVVVADLYLGGEAADAADADAAVAWLLPRCSGPVDGTDALGEVAANRIGLLVQACHATGDLIDHARRTADALPVGRGVEDLLAETVRHDPPVRTMRRVAGRETRVGNVEIAEGDLVVLDVAAANRDPDVFAEPDTFDVDRSGPAALTFGSGPRSCPAQEHALALAAGALGKAAAADDIPRTDDRDPAEVVAGMAAHVLALAATWPAWDGKPFSIDGRIYTPHKAIRRVADHLVDHLAEMEARLAGQEPLPDRWLASASTTAADLAPFMPADLEEARSRLTRLARVWANRLGTLTPDQLDHSPGVGWTFRQLAFHLAGSVYYADAVGDLSVTAVTSCS